MNIRTLLSFFATAMLAGSTLASAQSRNPAYDKTWDVFVGASAVHPLNGGSNAFGFDASISNRPYTALPWFGGTIAASGAFTSTSVPTTGVTYQNNNSFYTVMGGPSVTLPLRHAQPFARALFGETITRAYTTGGGLVNDGSSNRTFGYSLGGGIDFPFSRIFGVRAQADWVRSRTSPAESLDNLRTSAGLSARF